MSDSLRLATLSPGDEVSLAAIEALLEHADRADGQPAFNDQTRLELKAGRNHVVLATEDARLVGVAAVADDTLELVVAPDDRGRGIGDRLASAVPAPLAWAHGDHPAARRLAAKHGYEPVRRLLQLRRPLTDPTPESPTPDYAIGGFVAGVDDRSWVALNARVFAGHPEQGRITLDDLHARMNEPWFDPSDFLVVRDEKGIMVGYNWLKIDPAEHGIGEIYVIGVDGAHAGHGLGRALMERGLNRLRGRGCSVAALYVEEDNGPAVPLYRSLGFTDHTIDVQYSRP